VLNRDRIRQIVVLVTVIGGAIAANVISAISANGTTGDISRANFALNYFIPAGYVFFTIWPVIYAGLVALAVYQARAGQADNPRYRRAGYWLALNMVLNAGWVVIFDQERFLLAQVVIIALLVTALIVYRRLDVGNPAVPRTERWLQIPVRIYVGWLSVATIASTAGVLVTRGWDGWGLSYVAWTVIMLFVGAALGLLVRWQLDDAVYLGVFLYAYIGLVVAHLDQPILAIPAGGLAAVFAVILVYGWWAARRQPRLAASPSA
jgi:tryptophan-rich sensory protein